VAAGGGPARVLVGAGARSTAMLGIGIFLAAGGLVTSLALAGNDARPSRAAQAPPVAAAESEGGDGSKVDEDGPASGRASFGADPARAVERDAGAGSPALAQPVRTTPRTVVRTTERPAAQKPSANGTTSTQRPTSRPAAQPAAEDDGDERRLIDLGVLAVTNEGGVLGLPGVALFPPADTE
jgi:cell division septation protein DedD